MVKYLGQDIVRRRYSQWYTDRLTFLAGGEAEDISNIRGESGQTWSRTAGKLPPSVEVIVTRADLGTG